jgi:hypothetical protein
MTDLLIDTRPPDVATPTPAATAEPPDWAAGSPPQSRLAALLHLEVRHDDGAACYRRLAARAALAAAPLTAVASLGLSTGRHIDHGGLAEDLARWSDIGLAATAVILLVLLVGCVGATLVWHWLWHRDEAPYAYNEILPLDTTAVLAAGGPR